MLWAWFLAVTKNWWFSRVELSRYFLWAWFIEILSLTRCLENHGFCLDGFFKGMWYIWDIFLRLIIADITRLKDQDRRSSRNSLENSYADCPSWPYYGAKWRWRDFGNSSSVGHGSLIRPWSVCRRAAKTEIWQGSRWLVRYKLRGFGLRNTRKLNWFTDYF